MTYPVYIIPIENSAVGIILKTGDHIGGATRAPCPTAFCRANPPNFFT